MSLIRVVGTQGFPKNCVSHIDASLTRQPLVKGERLVRYEVNAVIHTIALIVITPIFLPPCISQLTQAKYIPRPSTTVPMLNKPTPTLSVIGHFCWQKLAS